MKIVFLYSDLPLSSGQMYDSDINNVLPDGATGAQFGVVASYAPPRVIDVGLKTGTTLSGRRYAIKTHTWRNHSLTISPDQIDESDAPFFEAWWDSRYKYISKYSTGSGFSNYILVEHEGGELPISYLDGIVMFPEFKFSLKETEAI